MTELVQHQHLQTHEIIKKKLLVKFNIYTSHVNHVSLYLYDVRIYVSKTHNKHKLSNTCGSSYYFNEDIF